jgi:hypothetical protein
MRLALRVLLDALSRAGARGRKRSGCVRRASAAILHFVDSSFLNAIHTVANTHFIIYSFCPHYCPLANEQADRISVWRKTEFPAPIQNRLCRPDK